MTEPRKVSPTIQLRDSLLKIIEQSRKQDVGLVFIIEKYLSREDIQFAFPIQQIGVFKDDTIKFFVDRHFWGINGVWCVKKGSTTITFTINPHFKIQRNGDIITWSMGQDPGAAPPPHTQGIIMRHVVFERKLPAPKQLYLNL